MGHTLLLKLGALQISSSRGGACRWVAGQGVFSSCRRGLPTTGVFEWPPSKGLYRAVCRGRLARVCFIQFVRVWVFGKSLFHAVCWRCLGRVCFILSVGAVQRPVPSCLPGPPSKSLFHPVCGGFGFWKKSISSCLRALSGKSLFHPAACAGLLGKSLFHGVCGGCLVRVFFHPGAGPIWPKSVLSCCQRSLARVCFILSLVPRTLANIYFTMLLVMSGKSLSHRVAGGCLAKVCFILLLVLSGTNLFHRCPRCLANACPILMLMLRCLARVCFIVFVAPCCWCCLQESVSS